MRKLGIKGDVIWVRGARDSISVSELDGLIIPGGESTTISRLMLNNKIFEQVQRLGESGTPIMGTCAGLILLAKEGDEQVQRTDQKLLELMDTKINRNAFGRQRESFEADVSIDFLDKPFHAVFIRAPTIEKLFGRAKAIAKFDGKIVGAAQGNLLALSFHPELTNDTRIHEYFLSLV
jgi:5'-phosphate synthase pdxT subunit